MLTFVQIVGSGPSAQFKSFLVRGQPPLRDLQENLVARNFAGVESGARPCVTSARLKTPTGRRNRQPMPLCALREGLRPGSRVSVDGVADHLADLGVGQEQVVV